MHRSRPDRTDARRRPGTAFAALIGALLLASPAAAQQQVRSQIAGIALPYASEDWSADPDGVKAAELSMAASLAARQCGAREFHRWKADPARAAAIADAIDAALVSGGWRIETIAEIDGQKTALARRQGGELIMRWLSEEGAVGWLICLVDPPPAAAPVLARDRPAEANPVDVIPAPSDPRAIGSPAPTPERSVGTAESPAPPRRVGPEIAAPLPPAAERPVRDTASKPAASARPVGEDPFGGWLPWIAVVSAVVAGLGIVLMVWSGRQAEGDEPLPYHPRRIAMDNAEFEQEIGRSFEGPARRPKMPAEAADAAAATPPEPRSDPPAAPVSPAPVARKIPAREIVRPAAPPSAPARVTAELAPPGARTGQVKLEEAVATALAEFRLANDEIDTARTELGQAAAEAAPPASAIEIAPTPAPATHTSAEPVASEASPPPPVETPPARKPRAKSEASRKTRTLKSARTRKPGRAKKPKAAGNGAATAEPASASSDPALPPVSPDEPRPENDSSQALPEATVEAAAPAGTTRDAG